MGGAAGSLVARRTALHHRGDLKQTDGKLPPLAGSDGRQPCTHSVRTETKVVAVADYTTPGDQ